jgi:peptidoglycan/LPS O-acetylase OafA/YrhL
LHNLDPNTCYSINGVFWTLAIEEQLYLAYFLLLFLRTRWGWGPTLVICAAARLAWFGFSHAAWVTTGTGIPVPEAAASHWLTWALGALAVENAFGLVQLPRWCRNVWLGLAAVVAASATSMILPNTQKDTFAHTLAWMLMHPVWGFGFFVLVNRAVHAEQTWASNRRQRARTIGGINFNKLIPRLVGAAALVGISSYSLYLTHELVIMQSYSFTNHSWYPVTNTLLIVVPATLAFAGLFYWFCERPYMRKTEGNRQKAQIRTEKERGQARLPDPELFAVDLTIAD